MLRADIESVLVSKEQIEQKITQLGRQITSDYHGKEIILACILRGSFIFAADLARHIDVPMTIEFLSASSYARARKPLVMCRSDRTLKWIFQASMCCW